MFADRLGNIDTDGAPTPAGVLREQGKSHRTKAELERREKGEAALLSGKKCFERETVKLDPVAHKEYQRLVKLMKAINKDDALYAPIYNRYCELFAEVDFYIKEISRLRELADTLEKKFDASEDDINKGDILSRYQAYKIALDSGFMQPDEVRYKEDLPALGFNYIKLALSDVLFDPKTKTIYTPNTNQTAKMGEQAIDDTTKDLQNQGDSSIIQKRYSDDQERDDHGRFASGGGTSSSGTKQ